MPDEPNDPPPPDGHGAPSDDTQRLGPDLTKHTPAEPSPYEAPQLWSEPQAYQQQPYQQQQPYPQQSHPQQPHPQYQQPYGQPGQPTGQQAPYGAPGAYGQPYGAAGYRTTGYPGYGSASPATSGKAVTVLVLGIASLVLLFMCGLGLITAVIALAMAPGAKREIRESQGRLGGLGMVQGGVITSWVAIGLVLLFVALWIGLMTFGGSIGSDFSSSDI